jgi:molybdate transport system ATP-binding protein
VDSGWIRLSGEPLDDSASGTFVPPDRRRVGVVFQDYLLFPHLNVIDNIAFGLRSAGLGKSAARSIAGEWVERLSLEGLDHRRPGTLSGGQAQRVALARALIANPNLLLLDEPLSALDVTTRVQMRRSLSEHLNSFPGPRLLITHDPIEAFLLADEIHIIEQGSVTQSGSADEIRLRPRTTYAADLVGANLLRGRAGNGVVTIGDHSLQVASPVVGHALVTIRPSSISVHRHQPEGSARNAWSTSIDEIERLGERVRLRLGPPLRLTAEVTANSVDQLHLQRGDQIWIALKATEIGVEPG